MQSKQKTSQELPTISSFAPSRKQLRLERYMKIRKYISFLSPLNHLDDMLHHWNITQAAASQPQGELMRNPLFGAFRVAGAIDSVEDSCAQLKRQTDPVGSGGSTQRLKIQMIVGNMPREQSDSRIRQELPVALGLRGLPQPLYQHMDVSGEGSRARSPELRAR